MPEGLGNYGYVLSVEYLGDDLFHINATLYGFVNGTLFASSLNPHFPFQPHGTVVIVEQKDFNATYSSSNLLTVLLPRNETVYFNGQEYEIFALNRSIYRPSTLGFPRIYTIPLNQSQGAVEAIHYVRTENCYIATGVYENITFVTQLFSANISANQGLCSLTYTSIVPADQDWAYGATFNFSFLAFPIPIVLFVAGLLLLILRARRS
ncbi:MAG: hypothetical protein QFX35_04180 [Candidatus Verstraetearchaeota archaeon]|nr:hypothetical protein [Candidatus Verstraetearchaeota archaeon]